MKRYAVLVVAGLILVCLAAAGSGLLEKGPVWRGETLPPQTPQEIRAEIQEKTDRLQRFMAAEELDGVLLTQVRNVCWITAGRANTQIVLNKDIGAASLLVRRDGSKCLLCSGSEAGRLMDESLGSLGYTLRQFNWFEANPVRDVRGEVLRAVVGAGRIGSDAPFPGTVPLPESFRRLRYRFTDGDLVRYRWLGAQAAEAVAAVCRRLTPGLDEFAIEAMTAAELRSRGLLPTVLLIAVDDRIAKYRHALPAGAVLKKYAMVNVVAEKWGMPVAVTRFVHFGPLPQDLQHRLEKTAWVDAKFQAATVPGKSCAEIFEEGKAWYAEAGYPGEWEKHHQGGAIGYDDREYVIYPGIRESVQERQPFAWNPTITGAKVEDTFVAFSDHAEVVTRVKDWPMIRITLAGKSYDQPAILVK
jgi:Xaa-Pro dipeptidase